MRRGGDTKQHDEEEQKKSDEKEEKEDEEEMKMLIQYLFYTASMFALRRKLSVAKKFTSSWLHRPSNDYWTPSVRNRSVQHEAHSMSDLTEFLHAPTNSINSI